MDISTLIDTGDLQDAVLATVTVAIPVALTFMAIGIAWSFAKRFIKQK